MTHIKGTFVAHRKLVAECSFLFAEQKVHFVYLYSESINYFYQFIEVLDGLLHTTIWDVTFPFSSPSRNAYHGETLRDFVHLETST